MIHAYSEYFPIISKSVYQPSKNVFPKPQNLTILEQKVWWPQGLRALAPHFLWFYPIIPVLLCDMGLSKNEVSLKSSVYHHFPMK